MSVPRFTCRGFAFKNWFVPPFELHENEAVTIVVPQELMPWSDDLIHRFSRNCDGIIECAAKVVWADNPRSPHGIWRWILGSSVSGWLRRNTSISRQRAQEIIRKLRVAKDDLRVLAGNPRLFLGLEAAWAQDAKVLIFSTRGNDPMGVRTAFELVSEHLRDCSAIYLAFPWMSGGIQSHDVFPGSAVVEIAQPLPATT